jgi:cell division protein FtsW
MSRQSTGRQVKSRESRLEYNPDYWLLGVVLVLTALGLIMVLSASGIMAERYWGDKYFFFRKQFLFSLIGLGIMWLSSKISLRFFYKGVYFWLVLAALLLGLTLTSFGVQAGGASRWLRVGPVSFQPLEVAKVALVFYLAYFFSNKQELVKTFSVGFLPPVLVTFVLGCLLLLQPDFGGAVYLTLLLFLISLVGGTRFIYLFSSLLLASGAAVMLVIHSPYRFRRWFAFLDPFKDAQDSGYQLVQSLYALGSGKIWGVGLGASKQKLYFLPDAHNDFILAVLGEELGFIGISIVFICLAILLWRSMRISLQQTDMQDRFTAFGMSMIVIVGAWLNAAVVLGAVPPKGVPMPFLSYGGTHLVVMFFCIGVLLNLSRQAAK